MKPPRIQHHTIKSFRIQCFAMNGFIWNSIYIKHTLMRILEGHFGSLSFSPSCFLALSDTISISRKFSYFLVHKRTISFRSLFSSIFNTLSARVCSKGNFLTPTQSYFNFTDLQLYLVMIDTMNANYSKIERSHGYIIYHPI